MSAGFGLLLLLTRLVACVATPLPTPPSADPSLMSLFQVRDGKVTLLGEDGAIDPGDADILSLRVTGAGAWTQVPVDPRGSFSATLPGLVTEVFYLEAIVEERDIFLVAVTGSADDSVIAVDPGPDSDDDGSPDVIDCASDEPNITGRRCEQELSCTTEVCNGVDDDCDRLIDEGCSDASCVDDSDCTGDRACIVDSCQPRSECADDSDCPDGQGCLDGICLTDFDPPECTDDSECPDGQVCGNDGCQPGVSCTTEVCNGVDDDCDDQVDEGCSGACTEDSECSGGLCLDGSCVCPQSFPQLCTFECVNIATDANHCGACNSPCANGQTCVDQVCLP